MKNATCSAPFNNLYFGNRGTVMACCANKLHVLGTYPQQRIAEIWHGHKANELRAAMAQNNFDLGCTGCRLFLENGNRSGAPLTAYDNIPQTNPQWPARLEFELTNTCNLECTMCTGEYSSSIRERRERKPPLHDPYDADFLLQLKEFIPHLSAARFVGGEPFLIQKYFEIMDMMASLNPAIDIYIQTNGTILNSRVKKLLEKIKASISVSIDSLQPGTYEAIRVNGTLQSTLDNIAYFSSYCKSQGTRLSFSFCSMTKNWREIPHIVAFANAHNASIFFNTVYYPAHLSLKSLPAAELENIYHYLTQHSLPTTTDLEKSNYKKYTDQCSEVQAFIAQANVSTPTHVAAVNAAHIHSKLKQYVASRENLSAQEQHEKSALIEEKLNTFLQVAEKQDLLPQTLLGLNALPEDVLYQNLPALNDVEHAFKEFRERILATLK